MNVTSLLIVSYPLVVFLAPFVSAFVPKGIHQRPIFSPIASLVEKVSLEEIVEEESTTVRAPLKFLGPYPALGLRFPNLATASQKERNISGIALDFVLDSAANTNTINGQVANELALDVVGEALPGIGSAGAMSGGLTYNLGDTMLEHMIWPEIVDNEKPFLFMQNLTASALPVANPASAGLLSLAFLYCFEGGVEFNWGSTSLSDGMMADRPSIAFFGEKGDMAAKSIDGLTKVHIDYVPITKLPSIKLRINGVEIPALLDTGSPITVLNPEAAKQAGIETISLPSEERSKSKNPFKAAADRFKEAQAIAKAAASGEVLTIAGPDGPVRLLKSISNPSISAIGEDQEQTFGKIPVFVGEIPGLSALNGIGVDAPPAIVLGMDVLRVRPKMVLRAQDDAVYF